MSGCLVHLFSKAPLAGKCKSRLAQGLNDPVAAANIQAKLLDMHLKKISAWIETKSDVQAHAWIQNLNLWTPPSNASLSNWIYHDVSNELELGGAIALALQAYTFVSYHLLIGTDTPALLNHLDFVGEAILERQALLGPTRDGGIYVAGFPSGPGFHPHQVSWGTNRVFDEMKSQFESAYGRTVVSPIETDIDLISDLHALDFANFS